MSKQEQTIGKQDLERALQLIVSAAEPNALQSAEQITADPSVTALVSIFDSIPPMPRYRERLALMSDFPRRVDASQQPQESEPTGESLLRWAGAGRLIKMLGGRPDDATPLTPEQSAGIMKKIAKTFRNGNIDVIARRLHETRKRLSLNEELRTLPFCLLHTIACATQDAFLSRADQSSPQALDEDLRTVCQFIRDDQKISPDYSTATTTVYTGAIKALNRAYHEADSQEYLRYLVTCLQPLYVTDARQRTEAELRLEGTMQAGVMMQELEAAGIKDTILKQPMDPGEIARIMGIASRKKAEYARIVDDIHAKLTMHYFAQRLVNAIADGEIAYSQLTAAAEQGVNEPLWWQREENDRIAAEENARRQAERDRITDLGYINLRLGLGTVEELREQLVGRDRSAERPRTTRSPNIGLPAFLTGYRDLEPYRAYVLVRLIEENPGSELYILRRTDTDPRAPAEPTKASTTAEDFDIRQTEGYLYLVTPEGHVVAEFPEPEHSTLLMRAEILQPGETWDQFFKLSIRRMVARGAVRIEHPREEDLSHDILQTTEDYVALLYYLLITSLSPGEKLPDSERLHRLPHSRVKKLGQGATTSRRAAGAAN